MLFGMPRPLRPIHDGLIYHVINRGNNRQDVFHKPADCEAFLAAWPTSKTVSRLSSSRCSSCSIRSLHLTIVY